MIPSSLSLAVWLRWAEVSIASPEGGKPAGTVSQAIPARQIEAATVTFVDTGDRLGIKVRPGVKPAGLDMSSQLTKAGEYSFDYALRMFVPVMGGSIALGDYDGDGDLDLYLVVPGASNQLFQNNGKGGFTDVTERAGVAGNGASLSATFADYDRSGRPSLFVVGAGGVTLYHNEGGGRFTDETKKAGLKGTPAELDTSALLFDADNDGFLDLLVTAYTDLAVPPSKPSFVFPNDFSGLSSHLYHNNGDGTFSDVTSLAGLASNPGRTRHAVCADFNSDGRPDLLLLRDNKPPVLYMNQGKGRFRDRTWDGGNEWDYAFFDGQVADFDHDGKPDLALWSTIGYRVLLNTGDAHFKEVESLPLIPLPPSPFGFHGTVADLNSDGFEDLLLMDINGRWHIIANRAGSFQEASFTLSSGPELSDPEDSAGERSSPVAFAAVVPARLDRHDSLKLLVLRPAGQIMVFQKQEAPTHSRAK